MQAALDQTDAAAAVVDDDGKAVGDCCVDAGAPKLRALQRALQKARASLDALATRQTELESIETEAERTDDPMSEAEAKLREKDRQKVEQLLSRAQKFHETGETDMSQQIQIVTERADAFVESFCQTESRKVTKLEVEAAQRAARAAFRHLKSCWQATLKAQESRARHVVMRRKAGQKRHAACIAHSEAEARVVEAQGEYSEATTEVAVAESKLSHCEGEVGAAEASRSDAERQEMEMKRRRDELRGMLAAAKEAVKPARANEKEAIAERQTIYEACSKVEGAQQKMEMAKSSAIQKLQSEEYVANQVEQAYVRAQSSKSSGANE